MTIRQWLITWIAASAVLYPAGQVLTEFYPTPLQKECRAKMNRVAMSFNEAMRLCK